MPRFKKSPSGINRPNKYIPHIIMHSLFEKEAMLREKMNTGKYYIHWSF